MKNSEYNCINGAWHDEPCCETCWNKHPKAQKGEMFIGSEEQKEISKNVWFMKAHNAGFTKKQAEFLYNNY
jgi:hypothetical protein